MKNLEALLNEVVESGDLRRKAAIELEKELKTVCDRIGDAAKKAGVWGKNIRVDLEDCGCEDFESWYVAYLTEADTVVDVNTLGERRVFVAIGEAKLIRSYESGYLETKIEGYDYVITDKSIRTLTIHSGVYNETPTKKTEYFSEPDTPSRYFCVKLAEKLPELVKTLHKRVKQLEKETETALEAVKSVDI